MTRAYQQARRLNGSGRGTRYTQHVGHGAWIVERIS
jgi:hypothetical protein